MSGVRVDLRVCEELIATLIPAVGTHLAELDAWTYGLRGMLTQWFMMLFVTALPLETTCRACIGTKYVINIASAEHRHQDCNGTTWRGQLYLHVHASQPEVD